MSKGLREIAAPKVVARPSGVRIRTRLRVSEQDLDVLLQVGVHLGKLAGQDLAARIRLGATKEDQRAARKQALTDASSSRWAGAITRTSNDQWQLSWRGLRTHRTDLEQAIATIERRIGVPVGERTGKTRGYGSQRERYMKQQRLQVLTARLEKVEAQIDAGRVHVVRGGRRLMKKLQHLIVQLADARAKATAEPKDTGLAQAAHRAEAELAAWKRSWIAERLFITADGEGGKRYGNESVHVDPVRQVVSLRLPTPLKDLANAKHGRYEIPLVKLFAQHTDEWRGRALSSQAVRYDISYDPVKNRVYIDASWKRTHVPAAPSLDAAVRDGLLAVDTNDGHLAARVLDQHGNPVGPAYTLRLDLDGLPASRRDGRVRAAISRLIALAKDAGVKAIAIEDLNFADARATGRETMGRGNAGKRFRRTVAGIPTAKLRDRMAAMVPRAGLTLVAVDPAYTSKWGKQHWLKPHETDRAVELSVDGTGRTTKKTSGHHAAALVIGRRAMGFTARRRNGVTPGDQRIAGQRATDQAPGSPARGKDAPEQGDGRRAPATRPGNTRPATPSPAAPRRPKTVRGADVSQNDTV